MENKKIVPVWVSDLLIALSITTMIYIGWYTFACDYFALAIVTNSLLCLILIDAMYYCVQGYKKKDAKSFNLFSILFMIATGLNVFNMVYHAIYAKAIIEDTISIAMLLISFGALNVLSFAKDLGKKKSYCFVSIVIVASAINTIVQYFIAPEAILCAFGAVIAAVIYFIMIYGKYIDKQARGSK